MIRKKSAGWFGAVKVRTRVALVSLAWLGLMSWNLAPGLSIAKFWIPYLGVPEAGKGREGMNLGR